ncbi:MAG: hypothetical protein KGM96_05180 [Acidobacteriota bacterium]|nr:hypothetical protein [Acidobacteriota bacterium]
MSQDVRLGVYRAALDAAHVELSDIQGQFEQLRLRKDRVEKVLEALKPMLGGDAPAAAPDQQAAAPSSVTEHQSAVSSNGPMEQGENPPQYQFMKIAESVPVRLQPAPNAWAIQPQRPLRAVGF